MMAVAETAPSFELVEDFSGIELAELPTPWWVYLIAGLVVCGLILAVRYFIRKKSAAMEADSEEIAYMQAKEKLSSISHSGIRSIATDLSMILRGYFQMTAADTALFETREEFEGNAKRLSSLSENLRADVEEFLRELAGLKYGGDVGEEIDSKDLVSRAEQLLTSARNSK